MPTKTDIRELLKAISAFRKAFVVAVGDKSPFARTALAQIDEATRKAAQAIAPQIRNP